MRLDIALTVNVHVKHPRSALPPTVLYNLSYLQLQLQFTKPTTEPSCPKHDTVLVNYLVLCALYSECWSGALEISIIVIGSGGISFHQDSSCCIQPLQSKSNKALSNL